MSKEKSSAGGIGLGGAVFLVFLVLKLTNHIDWSWWWITAPLWGFIAILIIIFVIIFIYICIAEWIDYVRQKKAKKKNENI
jgi:uncharacterized membrane protein